MGIFEVSEANRKAKCLEIKAYDFMVLCSTACDVALAQDRATIEAMPNGTENLSIYSELPAFRISSQGTRRFRQ